MIKFAADGILGFSTIPLQMITRVGLMISVLSVLVAAYAFAVKVFTPENAVPGWAFLGVGMFLLGGIQLVMMGIIGSYLGRVYVEVQNRPLYSVALVARGVDGSTHTSDAPS
jgi:dolichol-phosphate mannosyltransferase